MKSIGLRRLWGNKLRENETKKGGESVRDKLRKRKRERGQKERFNGLQRERE